MLFICVVADMAQPLMHGLLANYIKKHIVIGTVVAAASGAAWHFGIKKPRRDAYRNFYANYDAEEAYARMRAHGYFQSVPKGGAPAAKEEKDEGEEGGEKKDKAKKKEDKK